MIKALSRYIVRKALSEMRHPGGSILFSLLPRTKYDYARDVGGGTGSSVLMAPIQWLQKAFLEAPIVLARPKGGGEEMATRHDALSLLARPNKFYTGEALWQATVFAWCLAGNAYWVILRNGVRRPVELWWAPSGTIVPKAEPDDGKTFISHYEYTPGRGEKVDLQPEDVIHFRHGIDPDNVRLGISPLRSVMREVWTDDEASNWVGALLRNGGFPGVVISPREGHTLPMDADLVEKYIAESFSGDRRGKPMVMAAQTQVEQFGFSPQQMDLSVVRDTAEERVCACLGVAAAVVGFGAGLQTTRVGATMREMVRSSWTDGVIPLQKALAGELTRSLLPDLGGKDGERLEFDRRGIQALQDDLTDLYKRAQIGVGGGFLRVDEAKRMVGLQPDPADAIYLRSIVLAEVPAGRSMAEAERAPSIAGDKGPGNGRNGRKAEDPVAQRIAAGAPHRKPTRAGLAAMRSVDALHEKLSAAFAKRLREWFGEIGGEVARAAGAVLGSKALEDEIDVAAILDGTHFRDLLASGKRRYDAHFTATSRETFGAMDAAFGLQTDLPDPAAVRILEAGGKRFGLLDLRETTREKLFTILSESREEGLGAEDIKRRIREAVGAGPWSDPDIRARVVARTETLYAQNLSVAEYARAAGAPRVMVFDARLGPTDEECEALNGAIVSAEEAEALAASEHPNGTRSFTPWFEE
ncbi:MAG: phage portal protein [bacterium]